MLNSAYFKSYCIYKGWNLLGEDCDLCQSATSLSALPPTYNTHSSKTTVGFASFLYPQMIFMSITFIVAIKNTYRTIGCGKNRCRRRISQTCQYDQQLYRNEYNSYLIIIESQQLNNEVIVCLYEVEDIWILYKVYKTIHVSPNSFRAIKERKKTQN